MNTNQDKNNQKRAKRGRPTDGRTAKSLIGKKLRCIQGDKKNSDMQSILNVKGASYLRYLSGESVPSARALASLVEGTGVDLNWLLDDARAPPEDGRPVLYEPALDKRDDSGDDSRDPGIIIDAPLVAELQGEVEKLKARNEALGDALVSMMTERDKAREAAKTAGRLRDNNEASGA